MNMQRFWRPGNWSIATWLMVVATVPTLLIFAVIVPTLYATIQAEVQQTLARRGEMLAMSIAASSHHEIVSDNVESLRGGLQKMIAAEHSIAGIEILNHQRISLLTVRAPSSVVSSVIERPIVIAALHANVFDQSVDLHFGASANEMAETPKDRTVGFVRVMMSSGPIVTEKQEYLYVAMATMLLAAAVSGLAGLYLVQRLRHPLDGLMQSLRQLQEGNFELTCPTRMGGEIGAVQVALEDVARNLSRGRQELERQVADRTRELQQAIDQVQQADADKRRLIVRSNEVVEEERKRIAVEIHDAVNASLIAVSIQVQYIAQIARQMPAETDAREIERTAMAIDSAVKDLYSVTRHLVKQLRPEIIDTLGLRGALEEMVRHYNDLVPDSDFTLVVNPNVPDLHDHLAITIYRLVQEALANVVKHAEASQVVVSLEIFSHLGSAGSSMIIVVVRDNGRGFDPVLCQQGTLGLIGMRERAAGVGGAMQIETHEGIGTAVRFALPLKPEGDEGRIEGASDVEASIQTQTPFAG